MSTPKGHKVVTVPRGDGYAARCEVERDGVTHICGITFGGFRTKTEARAALAHEEAPTPAATGNEGDDQNPARGTIMTHDTPSTRWPVARHDGYDEVTIEDEEHGLRAFVSHIDGEDFWRLEVAFQELGAYQSCKEDQVAA